MVRRKHDTAFAGVLYFSYAPNALSGAEIVQQVGMLHANLLNNFCSDRKFLAKHVSDNRGYI